MAATLPSGIGNPQQAQQATAFMRQQPWYGQLVSSWGFDPSKTDANGNLTDPRTGQSVKLSDQQQQQLIATARANGIGISNSYNIDENGQIAKPDSHMLRNIAIAAAIGASLFIPGVTEAIGSAFGAGGGAAAGADAATGLAADGTLASTTIGSGFIPAIAGGTGADIAGLTAAGTAAAGTTSALATGSKLASLATGLGKVGNALNPANTGGPNSTSARGSAYAAEAAQLATNRAITAKTDQAGPAADAQAFKNQMRAALVARMDPNAAPLSLGGHALPTLATPEGVSAAATLRDTLAARIAAGKTATTFGIADPTQEELDAQAKAADAAGIGTGINSTLANIGDTLQTGSRLANLGVQGVNLGKTIAGWF